MAALDARIILRYDGIVSEGVLYCMLYIENLCRCAILLTAVVVVVLALLLCVGLIYKLYSLQYHLILHNGWEKEEDGR
jgi:hypothetical protein